MTLRLNGSTSGYTEIDAPAVAGSNTLVLPGGNGSAGQVLTTNGSGVLSWTGMGPAFRALNTTNQSISSGVFTKIIFQSETFDTANCFDNSTNYRFTPNVAGYYLVTARYNNTLGSYSNAFANCLIYKNGSAFYSSASQPVNGNYCAISVTTLVYMNGSSDYLEGYALANHSRPVIFGAPASAASFEACLIRPA